MSRIVRGALGALLWWSCGMMGCADPGTPGLIGPAGDGGLQGADAEAVSSPDGFMVPDDGVLDVPDMADVPDAAPSGPEAPSEAVVEAVEDFEGDVWFYSRNLATGAAVASGADAPVFGGELFRVFAAVTYAEQVSRGVIDPAETLEYTEDFLRSPDGFLGEGRIGQTFTLEDLARYTLVLSDRSAEALLVDRLGGTAAIQSTLTRLILPGVGRYLSPCERDRAFAEALDARFSEVSCVALARYLHGDDVSGITPSPFAEAPEFDDAAQRAAVVAMSEEGVTLATARAWGELLTRLYRGTLVDAATNATLRTMLEGSLGSGGGGDAVPSPLWISNLSTGFYAGRHWIGLARPPAEITEFSEGLEPLVLVMLTADRQVGANPGRLFATLGRLLHEQLVAPVDLTPPLAGAQRPEWLEGVYLVEANEAAACNAEHGQDFDALKACREAGERAGFLLNEETAGGVLVREGPQADVAWIWTQPDGTRHRYQQRLSAGGWWAWTRSFRAFLPGTWRLDIYINGEPYMLRTFQVSE